MSLAFPRQDYNKNKWTFPDNCLPIRYIFIIFILKNKLSDSSLFLLMKYKTSITKKNVRHFEILVPVAYNTVEYITNFPKILPLSKKIIQNFLVKKSRKFLRADFVCRIEIQYILYRMKKIKHKSPTEQL